MSETGANGFQPRALGRTGLQVGRLGIAGGFGASSASIEMAFERGCNYFYHGSLRRKGMTEAVRNIGARGWRNQLVVVAQIYTRWPWLFRRSFYSFLKKNRLEYIDILLLGWINHEPRQRIMEICEELKERGEVRALAVSGHNRTAFLPMTEAWPIDVCHFRYNAAHRGAETDVFPHLPQENRPGLVAYTATSWRQLLNPRHTRDGERTPQAVDCYRFVLTDPAVDVCITGAKNDIEMKENLTALDRGPLSDEELRWMRRIGDRVRG